MAKDERLKNFISKLERNPELLERFDSILDLAEDDQEQALDEIEGLLIDEVRKLGNETMAKWVQRREEQEVAKLKKEKRVQQREKKR
jgi:hypothetical protein